MDRWKYIYFLKIRNRICGVWPKLHHNCYNKIFLHIFCHVARHIALFHVKIIKITNHFVVCACCHMMWIMIEHDVWYTRAVTQTQGTCHRQFVSSGLKVLEKLCFDYYSNHFRWSQILHMSWQPSCHDLCNFVTWCNHYFSHKNNMTFTRFWSLVYKLLGKWVP